MFHVPVQNIDLKKKSSSTRLVIIVFFFQHSHGQGQGRAVCLLHQPCNLELPQRGSDQGSLPVTRICHLKQRKGEKKRSANTLIVEYTACEIDHRFVSYNSIKMGSLKTTTTINLPLLPTTTVTHLHSLVKKTQLLIETLKLLTSSTETNALWVAIREKVKVSHRWLV